MSTSTAFVRTRTPSPTRRPQPESLKEEARNAIDEARMVLPGIQALFGFQLIAVFNDQFGQLESALKTAHLVSLCLVVVSIALIMTPAAYDRIVDEDRGTGRFVHMTSWLLTLAMAILSLAMVTELYVVAIVITASPSIAAAIACSALLLLTALWLVMPLRTRWSQLSSQQATYTKSGNTLPRGRR